MNKIQTTLLFCLIALNVAFGQKQISLNEIWNGSFQSQRMVSVNSMKNSNQYSLVENSPITSSYQINLFDFASLKKVATLFDTALFSEIGSIDSYSFSADEKKILIATNSEAIFRRSFTADYYVYDLTSKKIQKVADFPIQEPVFSKDGLQIAFAHNNNLYHYNIATKTVVPITNDGKKNHIINGISDWVYEEEFAVVSQFSWNNDGTKIAYVKFDETEVPEYSMDIYGKALYPTQSVFKYPKAGEKNALVSLHIYDVKTQKTARVNLSNYTDFYIPRIQWTKETNFLSVQIINRHQNNLDLLFVNAQDASAKIVLNETDNAYIDITDNLTFLQDNSFIWTSEKDGYNHIYHYSKSGQLLQQITKGNWEVTEYYGYNEKTKTLYFQSVETGSIKRDVFSIQLDGKNKKQLTTDSGTNSALFSPNFDLFINTFSSSVQAPVYTLKNSKNGQTLKTIVSNENLDHKLKAYGLPKKEFIEIPTENGDMMNAWILKPANFQSDKKYPVLMYQYSGPGSQQVADKWWDSNDFWHAMLTQNDYIVVAVDGRGTGFKGAKFKKSTQNQLGKLEVEDQIIAAKYLGNFNYIDPSRIGIWGWSFGGFMSTNCILKGADVFKTAIAVAPVTNWRFYDTIYTERYLKTPQENESGYDENSPIFFANQLKGKYLLIHGSADDNVHVQNTMVMVEALIQKNKQFDWLIYPDKNHGIYGGATRLQLYTKMTDFITKNL
ncbi:S9 family peptidase [Flavobacterium sp. NKUCC04_CG]|uniref:S9 family peptidase n=1 Tax=Flavobacterium sp. NKUCC04_CG TaxID=2842121 RepID=UPI001C5B79E1|nr:S9 family peptidase [Flavobacterium sp. NKUCC04_CG]MBW3519004.1 S9 family peptidase [Flavobacterium sp. NKUCC04_CG]